MIRDIFHLYLFASPLKFNISLGDAELLPAPQNKACVAQGYFKLFSPVSSTQEQQLPFQPLLGAGARSQSLYTATVHPASRTMEERGGFLGLPYTGSPKKKSKEKDLNKLLLSWTKHTCGCIYSCEQKPYVPAVSSGQNFYRSHTCRWRQLLFQGWLCPDTLTSPICQTARKPWTSETGRAQDPCWL